MLGYKHHLKPISRKLRKKQTRAELLLWSCLRKKQILGVLFGRQKPIGPYIVDFYAHAAKLVIELDGSQHYNDADRIKDAQRDAYMVARGLKVLRFNNLEVLFNTETVVRVIEDVILEKPYKYEHGKYIEMF